MSFWENNKGTFKSAGIATAKGIGSGTKALGKAGYSAYKNHDNKRKGIEPKITDTESYGPPAPARTDNIDSFPAPPRRNVDANGARIPSANPQQPSQLPTQPVGPIAAPAYDLQPQQLPQSQVPANQRSIYTNTPPLPGRPQQYVSSDPQNARPTYQQNLPQAHSQQPIQNPSQAYAQQSVQNAPQAAYSQPDQRSQQGQDMFQSTYTQKNQSASLNSQEEVESGSTSYVPHPELSSLPPPPVRKERLQSSPSLSKTSTNNSVSSNRDIQSVHQSASNINPPPPPLRRESSNPIPKLPSRTSAPSIQNGNQIPKTSSGTEFKKKPPPKPTKKPQIKEKPSSNPPSYDEISPVLPKRPSGNAPTNNNSIPNFAEEIASQRTTNLSKLTRGSNYDEPNPEETNNQASEVSSISERIESLNKEEKSAPPIIGSKPQIKPKPDVGAKPPLSKARSNASSVQQALNDKSGSGSPTPPPPPSRNYVRPKAPVPPVSKAPPNLELDLESGWYDLENFHLPKSLQGLNYQTSYSYQTSGGDTVYSRTVRARLQDLSTVTVSVKWRGKDYKSATGKIESFVESPLTSKSPDKKLLLELQSSYGDYVASWSERKVDQTVGRGECWDLAHDALEKGCGKHAFVSEYYVHGYPILSIEGIEGRGIAFVDGTSQRDEVRRGDILQFTTAVFKDTSGGTKVFGDPDHTSVVLENTGFSLIVAEQNVSNVRKVVKGEVILKDLTKGRVTAFRPIPANWVEKL